jgi:hypothetical protein
MKKEITKGYFNAMKNNKNIKVTGTGTSWFIPWWLGFLFVLGLCQPNIENFWELIMYFACWPYYIGEFIAGILK